MCDEDADADRHINWPVCGGNGRCRDGLSYLAGSGQGVGGGATGEDYEEFLSAKAAYEIVGTHGFNRPVGDLDQDLIANGMAVLVIDVFEEVQVSEQDCSAAVFARTAGEFTAQHFQDGPAVEQGCEGIVVGLEGELIAGALEFSFDGFQRGDIASDADDADGSA